MGFSRGRIKEFATRFYTVPPSQSVHGYVCGKLKKHPVIYYQLGCGGVFVSRAEIKSLPHINPYKIYDIIVVTNVKSMTIIYRIMPARHYPKTIQYS